VGEQDERPPPDLTSTWADGPQPTPTGPATWVPPLVQRKRRLRGPYLVGGALVGVLLIGAGLFLFRGDPLTLGGRYVIEPEAVLAEADQVLASYVQDRHGVIADDGGCWFELAGADGHEVRDAAVCGPVLFVDGDPDRTWLHFPMTETADGGDVRLTVAGLPVNPEPDRLADPGLLRRPGGGDPPEGAGGLQVPPPPRPDAGWSATGPFPDVTYTEPQAPSRLSGPAAAVTMTGLAEPARVGTGDDARRPAEGERFVAVRYAIDRGEGRSTTPPAVSYQVSGAEPVPVAPALIGPGTVVEAVISVPEDAEAADLVVDDAGFQQRLSLLTGAPGPDNLQVLARVNRRVDLNASQELTGTLSAPGLAPTPFPFTVNMTRGTLQWFAGADGTKQPADPSRAWLVLDVSMSITGSPPSAAPVEYLSLTLPDGDVVRAIDLNDDPGFVLAAFDVPAGFTAGVIGFAGIATFPDTAVADFGPGRLDFRIEIPAG
jgi:hypothetical protein